MTAFLPMILTQPTKVLTATEVLLVMWTEPEMATWATKRTVAGQAAMGSPFWSRSTAMGVQPVKLVRPLMVSARGLPISAQTAAKRVATRQASAETSICRLSLLEEDKDDVPREYVERTEFHTYSAQRVWGLIILLDRIWRDPVLLGAEIKKK
ncbi:eukaryotic-like diacylglycerol kinase [Striga asiatica]|uniref:Eukaryotic-like diacylglycerol kinase n=1 Tax=Striga asiatica TaxID=4170 RepID=A0A5A7R0Q8_STRAF|nr:eukaryotic-like diacylglycerol kinase [Striga asiatica]